jgi:hypothetical protein
MAGITWIGTGSLEENAKIHCFRKCFRRRALCSAEQHLHPSARRFRGRRPADMIGGLRRQGDLVESHLGRSVLGSEKESA